MAALPAITQGFSQTSDTPSLVNQPGPGRAGTMPWWKGEASASSTSSSCFWGTSHPKMGSLSPLASTHHPDLSALPAKGHLSNPPDIIACWMPYTASLPPVSPPSLQFSFPNRRSTKARMGSVLLTSATSSMAAGTR